MRTRILLWIVLSFFGLTIASAQQAPNKSKKVEFAVGGNCEQCKARIEKAAYSVKGVKSANWNIKSGNMTLIFDERKCSESDVQKAIAKVGHDAGKERADDEVYKNLHHCCLYERLP